MPRRLPTATIPTRTARSPGRLLTDKILPVSQFFAYLEVGQENGLTFEMPDSSLWTLYERLRARRRAAIDAQGQRAQRDLPGVSRSLPAP